VTRKPTTRAPPGPGLTPGTVVPQLILPASRRSKVTWVRTRRDRRLSAMSIGNRGQCHVLYHECHNRQQPTADGQDRQLQNGDQRFLPVAEDGGGGHHLPARPISAPATTGTEPATPRGLPGDRPSLAEAADDHADEDRDHQGRQHGDQHGCPFPSNLRHGRARLLVCFRSVGRNRFVVRAAYRGQSARAVPAVRGERAGQSIRCLR